MNAERFIIFFNFLKRKLDYEHDLAHKVYQNKLNQNFGSDKINHKWAQI